MVDTDTLIKFGAGAAGAVIGATLTMLYNYLNKERRKLAILTGKRKKLVNIDKFLSGIVEVRFPGDEKVDASNLSSFEIEARNLGNKSIQNATVLLRLKGDNEFVGPGKFELSEGLTLTVEEGAPSTARIDYDFINPGEIRRAEFYTMNFPDKIEPEFRMPDVKVQFGNLDNADSSAKAMAIAFDRLSPLARWAIQSVSGVSFGDLEGK